MSRSIGLSYSAATCALVLSAGAIAVSGAGVAAAEAENCTANGTIMTCVYVDPGAEHKFEVPDGVTTLTVTAAGGTSPSSPPADVVIAPLTVEPGTTLYVNVGCGREASGSKCTTASDVRTKSKKTTASFDTRLIAAAGSESTEDRTADESVVPAGGTSGTDVTGTPMVAISYEHDGDTDAEVSSVADDSASDDSAADDSVATPTSTRRAPR